MQRPYANSLRRIPMTAIAGFVLLLSPWPALADCQDTQATPDWIRGSGKDLSLRLTAKVTDSKGRHVHDASASIRMTYNSKTFEQVDTPISDGRFSAWLPVNKYKWFALFIDVKCPDGARCTRVVERQELRELVVNGLQVTVEQPSKTVRVATQFDGEAVPGATVRLTLNNGAVLRCGTDGTGEASFELLQNEKLSKLTAWTKTGLLGGYQFSRKPTRDPDAAQHTVDLAECKPMQLHVKDEAGAPVAGVAVEVHAATSPPNFNYFGTPDSPSMVTDKAGVTDFPWFPKIENPHFYASVLDEGFQRVSSKIAGDQMDVIIRRPLARRTITGQVSSGGFFAGGFSVKSSSFDAYNNMNNSERPQTFTDADGTFSLDIVPDATYAYYVDDFRWTSQMSDGMLYDSQTNQSVSPSLFLSEGLPVRIVLTAGPSEIPIEDVTVGISTKHSFKWKSEGRPSSGVVGRQVRIRSNKAGVVDGFAPPGKLDVSFYTPQWLASEKYEVKRDRENVFHFHRAAAGAVKFVGQLSSPDGDVALAQVHAGSIDGETRDSFIVKSDQNGRFEFETIASSLGIVALTNDGRFAASTVVEDVSQPAKIALVPTMSYHGKLIDQDDQPVAGHKVWATISAGANDYNKPFISAFRLPPISGKTEADGSFRFDGLPSNAEIYISADDDQPNRKRSIDKVFLIPGETRPVKIARLGQPASRPSPDSKSTQEQYDFALRDCHLFKHHLMVIVHDTADSAATDFVASQLLDYASNRTISNYMQLPLDSDAAAQSPLAAAKKWPTPSAGSVFICAYDGQDKELARKQLDVKASDSVSVAKAFLDEHAPPKLDAIALWDKAFAGAKKTDRRVWAIAGGRYCGPCFRLGRWIDDHKEVLQQHFVIVKIDGFAHTNGREVTQRFIQGRQVGIPFYAMYDANENMLADSYGPLGNVGFMSGYEGIRHFRKMLESSCQNITPAQIEDLLGSLPQEE